VHQPLQAARVIHLGMIADHIVDLLGVDDLLELPEPFMGKILFDRIDQNRFFIFDEEGRKLTAIGTTRLTWSTYTWSRDNSEEIKKGWIIKADTLKELKDFNIERIYRNPAIKTQAAKIKRLYADLFAKYLNDILDNDQESGIFKDFLDGMSSSYLEETEPAEVVRDFIAGMTDEYFLEQGQIAFMPQPLPRKF